MTHEQAAEAAFEHYREGLRRLFAAVELLRGPYVDASPEAMRTEQALTRAIDVLRTQGFGAPRKG